MTDQFSIFGNTIVMYIYLKSVKWGWRIKARKGKGRGGEAGKVVRVKRRGVVVKV